MPSARHNEVMLKVSCPFCGEARKLAGRRRGDVIQVRCGSCGGGWDRALRPTCDRCDGDDMQPAVLAIVEKGRGTQLSVVGTRIVHLCSSCDAETLVTFHRNRPNPLMPDDLPHLPS